MTTLQYSDPKQFGYYSVGNNHVFSKIEALELSERLNLPIRFHFNDEVFSACDWKNEPVSSLSELYIQRARQIKLKYDYIVLFYSGGADSHNMLEAFLHAGVYPDEIASFHSFNDPTSSLNREINETAIPYVKQLKESGRLPKSTTHRLIDFQHLGYYANKKIDWHNYRYNVNTFLSLYSAARVSTREHILDYRNMISSGKKIGFIWGHDKPRVTLKNNKYYLFFVDIQDSCIPVESQQNPIPGSFDEFFYHTPDLPEIVIKQSFIVKHFIDKCNATHPYLTRQFKPTTGELNINGVSYWLSQDGLSYLIYPWFNDKLYYETKEHDVITSNKDPWFWKDLELSKNFHSVVNELTNTWGTKYIKKTMRSRHVNIIPSRMYQFGQ